MQTCSTSMEPVVGSSGGGGGDLLPNDALSQIFVRLPGRVVWRVVRAVCRSWRDLASDPGFLRAHAHSAAAAASSSPLVLSWAIAKGAATSDLLLTVDNATNQEGQPPSRSIVRVALPSLCRETAETRSWDGILCMELVSCLYALVNPLTGARTVVAAPSPRDDEGRRRYARGYIAGAYSHPVTGTFHLLHCTSQAPKDAPPVTISFRVLRVDGASDWRDIPMPADAGTAMLRTIAGCNFGTSSATVDGRLHWRDMFRGQKELLVFDAVKEEFESMPLPPQLRAGDAVVGQKTITTMSGKLCILHGFVGLSTVEVWVLEDYRAREWWLRQRFDMDSTPHRMPEPSNYHGNVGLITVEDRVEKIVFCCDWRKQVYDVRRKSWSLWWCHDLFDEVVAIHTESIAPHDVAFGAAPTQGIALLTHPDPNLVA